MTFSYHSTKMLRHADESIMRNIMPGDRVYFDPDFPGSPHVTGLVVSVSREGIAYIMWDKQNYYPNMSGSMGSVYAPYVPLQVTPTIFSKEDPKKGIMARLTKKIIKR